MANWLEGEIFQLDPGHLTTNPESCFSPTEPPIRVRCSYQGSLDLCVNRSPNGWLGDHQNGFGFPLGCPLPQKQNSQTRHTQMACPNRAVERNSSVLMRAYSKLHNHLACEINTTVSNNTLTRPHAAPGFLAGKTTMFADVRTKFHLGVSMNCLG